MKTKQCKRCSKSFAKPKYNSQASWKKRIYCSLGCAAESRLGNVPKTAFKKGHKTWNKGKPHNKETIRKLIEINNLNKRIGKENHNWKGRKAGYSAIHIWVNKHKKRPDNCSKCGKKGNSHQIHWSNKDHKYQRNLDDYIALCASCHKKSDKANGLCTH